MAWNDYMRGKWKNAFKFWDVNRDGVLTKDDFQAIPERVGKATGASAEELEPMRQIWLCKFLQISTSHCVNEIDEAMYIAYGKQKFEEDIAEAKRLEEQSYRELFDLLDLDKDGQISYDELEIYYQSHGISQKDFIQRVFKKLDLDGDGFVDKDELVKAGVNYWWNANPDEGYAIMYDTTDLL